MIFRNKIVALGNRIVLDDITVSLRGSVALNEIYLHCTLTRMFSNATDTFLNTETINLRTATLPVCFI